MLEGGCRCGDVRFSLSSEPVNTAVCNCGDCRGQSGAPILAWAMCPSGSLSVDGEPVVYPSSESGRRSFCGRCGTGLFFVNEALDRMGMVQVRIAALDDPNAVPPRMQIQVAERLHWMATVEELPAFERFPD